MNQTQGALVELIFQTNVVRHRPNLKSPSREARARTFLDTGAQSGGKLLHVPSPHPVDTPDPDTPTPSGPMSNLQNSRSIGGDVTGCRNSRDKLSTLFNKKKNRNSPQIVLTTLNLTETHVVKRLPETSPFRLKTER